MRLAMRLAVALALGVALALADARAQVVPSFQGLGDLPGGSFRSEAWGVSADGSVVVGSSSTGVAIPFVCDDTEAFRWTEAGGIESLGVPTEYARTYAYGVSADGSTAVGLAGTGSVCVNWGAFRWTESGGMAALPFFGVAHAASADGSVVVGYARTQSGDRAVRWTPEGGSVSLGALGATAGQPRSEAYDVSDDGSLVAGVTSSPSYNTTPFRWTAAGGMQALGDVQGRALAVGPEGSCIAGRAAFGGPEHQAFLWSELGGFVPLPYLTGGPIDPPPMWVHDASTGCAHLVGYAETGSFPIGRDAFLWSGRLGMRRMADVLAQQGLDLGDWSLAEATGVSADGRTLVGWGTNPTGDWEGWIARLPEPGAGSLGLAAAAALAAVGASRRRSWTH
jgi:probable HAF family extracellular repeat protein